MSNTNSSSDRAQTNDDKVPPNPRPGRRSRSSSVKRPRFSLRPNARSSAGYSSSHELDGKLYLSKVASLNKDDVQDTVRLKPSFGGTGRTFTSSEMVSAIPRRHDTRTPEKPRKLSNPRLKGDKLIVRLKLRPSILAQFPTKPKPLEKKPTTKPLIKEHNAHQLQFLDQLISEQSTELNRLNQERSITTQNIENYERVCSMHLDTLHRSLADACDLGMTSCELKDGDGDSTRLLKDDIQQMRQGVQNWSRILMEAKQDLASKKHQITMIATSLKTLEEERQQLSQWM
ncbi:hypothetical protein HYE67_006607 [Fusarium culmorum]|uniref:Uncharacterized protein n=1 Tax=Fusarium culmorum TaxID=5516 RepID=A0A2T4H0L2_FUSCU|nr:hypothetical protein FCULG_00007618 [Fusarium culmorum]QPC64376.1 hypothetical protein HYE67_006607 [Fusarium culmorum]